MSARRGFDVRTVLFGQGGSENITLKARSETALSMESRAAQLNNDLTMEMREREILFRIGNEAQVALRHQRAHLMTEHHQLVQEGEAQR